MHSTTLRLGIAITLGLVCCAALRSDDRVDDRSLTVVYCQTQDWEAAVALALDKKVTVKHTDIELRAFVTKLKEITGLLWLIDRRALEDVGISDDVPLTFQFKEMSVRSILSHVLRDLDLTWVIRDLALVITTPEEAAIQMSTRVIDVADLIRPFPGAPEELLDYDSVIELLTSIVAPQSWQEVGGLGSIETFRGGLVVSQTRKVLQESETLLRQIRAARKLAERYTESPPLKPSVGPADDDPVTAKIANALNRYIHPEFSDVPLSEVAEHLTELCDINIILDSRALDDVGVPTDVPVSFQADRIQVRYALRHMLRNLELSTTIRDEALVITTPEEAECRLTAVAYPVADLMGSAGESDLFGDRRRPADMDCLIELVTTSIAANSWDVVGGPCGIEAFSHFDVLVISQTTDGHEAVADLFAKARRHLAAAPVVSDEQTVADPYAKTRLVVYSVPSALSQSGQSSKSQENPASKQTRHVIQGDAVLSQMGMGGGMGGMGGGRGNAVPTAQLPQVVIPESQLLGTIMELVEPNSWADRDDLYAKVLPGRLLIRQTDAVHRKIELLLNKLNVPFRIYATPQIHHRTFMGGSMP